VAKTSIGCGGVAAWRRGGVASLQKWRHHMYDERADKSILALCLHREENVTSRHAAN